MQLPAHGKYEQETRLNEGSRSEIILPGKVERARLRAKVLIAVGGPWTPKCTTTTPRDYIEHGHGGSWPRTTRCRYERPRSRLARKTTPLMIYATTTIIFLPGTHFSVFGVVGIATPPRHPMPEGQREHQPTNPKTDPHPQISQHFLLRIGPGGSCSTPPNGRLSAAASVLIASSASSFVVASSSVWPL